MLCPERAYKEHSWFEPTMSDQIVLITCIFAVSLGTDGRLHKGISRICADAICTNDQRGVRKLMEYNLRD